MLLRSSYMSPSFSRPISLARWCRRKRATGRQSVCTAFALDFLSQLLFFLPVCVLKANELKLYVYAAETDPSPERTVFFDDLTVVGECKEARAAYAGFSIRSRDKTYYFCTETAKERDSAYSSSLGLCACARIALHSNNLGVDRLACRHDRRWRSTRRSER